MRVLLILGIATGLFIFTTNAKAQELSIESALGLCMKMPRANDRLECFEALARAAAPEATANIEKNRKRNNDSNIVGDQEQGTAGIEVQTRKKRGGIFPFNRFKKSKQKFVFVKPGETPPSRPGRAPAPVKRVAYDAKVLKAWRNAADDLYIALDNGEVWKHADPGRPRIPKPQAVIHMKPGLAGAWFMSFANRSPRIRVRLIRAAK